MATCHRKGVISMATHQRGRDAGTGRIITVKEAERRPRETVVETYKTGKQGPKN